MGTKQIKDVRIEDLLERDPIVLDNVNISREVKDKTVLVTGAAGSIGSEIARQLLHYNPKKVILFDQAESALYDLETDLKEKHPVYLKSLPWWWVMSLINSACEKHLKPLVPMWCITRQLISTCL
ncbi:MAG: polysaccharide biosynthesis protein [Owenweeksia sp.]|nr:polysaccharide biosynthesis protein [Owenweeksia sp.]